MTISFEGSFSSTSLQIAPIDSPGILGTQTVFIYQLFLRDTARIDGIALQANAFVSWIKTIHSFPISSHFFATPESNNKL
jgi:hypothetical protein